MTFSVGISYAYRASDFSHTFNRIFLLSPS
jgi:hypothetical protein